MISMQEGEQRGLKSLVRGSEKTKIEDQHKGTKKSVTSVDEDYFYFHADEVI
jgi:hypothetical protein